MEMYMWGPALTRASRLRVRLCGLNNGRHGTTVMPEMAFGKDLIKTKQACRRVQKLRFLRN